MKLVDPNLSDFDNFLTSEHVPILTTAREGMGFKRVEMGGYTSHQCARLLIYARRSAIDISHQWSGTIILSQTPIPLPLRLDCLPRMVPAPHNLFQVLYLALKTLSESGHQHVYNAVERPLLLAQSAAVLEESMSQACTVFTDMIGLEAGTLTLKEDEEKIGNFKKKEKRREGECTTHFEPSYFNDSFFCTS
ncbi:very-long-chain (3R)-3-hydroxyacyl-CoA dehydratase PASTICCINO 2A [Pyrus ussuriensis x Pyrus communis]|uniref:Very-long-chain (3R)-3-hydroxyacyl-CoA dehydratase PASTICCINO 2A n=1 Tax=Pyrus ussuriensis x Pyrus communis TaxID=2448454 RepID=A0A5N5H372_9ROSA|nr:very-long-chain (3R)-3-hydroxyacyl-CoA dehydratase PASTICCINO 2A [Pyrus ussuriensis x Pyrus communis]